MVYSLEMSGNQNISTYSAKSGESGYFLLPPNRDPERRVKVNCYAQLTSAASAHAQRCNFLVGVLEL